MELLDRIRELGDQNGIDFIGVAGLRGVKEKIRDISGSFYADYDRALSIGIVLQKSIVDLLQNRVSYENRLEYRTHAYDIINARLDWFASVAASAIQRAGYGALPLTASERIDSERVCASLSHKLTARLAGFGWIGKNCLLINPQYGPRVRWTTVLTDAPFEENTKIEENRCGDCRVCVKSCPAQAILGRNFHEDEPRAARLDVKKCAAYFARLGEEGGPAVCGMCLYACPYGRRAVFGPSASKKGSEVL